MLFVVLLVAALAVATGWWWRRRAGNVAAEVDRFATARAMTSRWATDPSSAPKPVQDIVAGLVATGTEDPPVGADAAG